MEILRTKGFLRLESGREYVVQGVTDIFEMKELVPDQRRGDGKAEGKGEEMGGKLVFIGRGIGPGLISAFKQYIGI